MMNEFITWLRQLLRAKAIPKQTTGPISERNYVQWRDEQFAHETVDSLYEQIKAFQGKPQ